MLRAGLFRLRANQQMLNTLNTLNAGRIPHEQMENLAAQALVNRGLMEKIKRENPLLAARIEQINGHDTAAASLKN